MITSFITLNGSPGGNTVSHHSLRMRRVIAVAREGTFFDLKNAITPSGSRQVGSFPGTGTLAFSTDNPFDFNEKVYVWFKL